MSRSLSCNQLTLIAEKIYKWHLAVHAIVKDDARHKTREGRHRGQQCTNGNYPVRMRSGDVGISLSAAQIYSGEFN